MTSRGEQSSRTPTLAKWYAKQRVGSSPFRRFSMRSDAEKREKSGQERTESAQKVVGEKYAASYVTVHVSE